MSIKLSNELQILTKELVEATEERDAYEIEYEVEKARMMFSAEVNGMSNQVMRDAQVTIMMTNTGMYLKMCTLRTRARVAWYKWATIRSLVDGKATEE